MSKGTSDRFLQFIKQTQELKSTLRHSWTSDKNRQESSAEHTWHLTLMALILEPYLSHKVDLLRVLKMLVIHDLGEALTGDIPAFEIGHDDKFQNEKKAIVKITQSLSSPARKEILNLWLEFEKKETREALFAKMLDVLDVLNQHLIADISTWSEIEFTFNIDRKSEKYFMDESVLHSIFLSLIKRLEEKIDLANRN